MKLSHLLTALICLSIGVVIGWVIAPSSTETTSENPKEIRQSGYKFINPLLECEYNQALGEKEFKPSKDKIEAIIAQASSQKKAKQISVYYRDLNNGPWFGINETNAFAPASLLKVPILMAYLKQAEMNPALLSEQYTLTTKVTNISTNFPDQEIEINHPYSVEELVSRMIINSDNQALNVLQSHIHPFEVEQITRDLGIETATVNTPNDFMSVRGYASLFRILYNASYLNHQMSEKALSILSQSHFNKGLTAKLHSSVLVAHKFGERELEGEDHQLHDCGIIYYPNHPYLLCIMTKGNNYDSLSAVIAQISEQVYADINQRYAH